jgi:hypothetical protein
MTITIESEPIWDAVNDIVHIHQALTHRHGDRFRALERKIAALGEGSWGVAGQRELCGDHVVLTPPARLRSIIREARDLGVIR